MDGRSTYSQYGPHQENNCRQIYGPWKVGSVLDSSNDNLKYSSLDSTCNVNKVDFLEPKNPWQGDLYTLYTDLLHSIYYTIYISIIFTIINHHKSIINRCIIYRRFECCFSIFGYLSLISLNFDRILNMFIKVEEQYKRCISRRTSAGTTSTNKKSE